MSMEKLISGLFAAFLFTTLAVIWIGGGIGLYVFFAHQSCVTP